MERKSRKTLDGYIQGLFLGAEGDTAQALLDTLDVPEFIVDEVTNLLDVAGLQLD